jgi:mRNA-degrading endonuclease RelE of RelBE toxin-antitoxin system
MFKPFYNDKFIKAYDKLPLSIQRKVDKQIKFLLQDLRYPSIRAKKLEGFPDVWEGRVDRSYRFIFIIKNDVVTFIGVGPHDEGLGKK